MKKPKNTTHADKTQWPAQEIDTESPNFIRRSSNFILHTIRPLHQLATMPSRPTNRNIPQATSEVAGLTNQPRGIDIEYRVIAINNAGTSVPSNIVDVVL